MLYDIIKDFCELNGWVFDYGRSDYHNLFGGLPKDEPHLFLDPIITIRSFGGIGELEAETYEGKMFVCFSSSLDEGGYAERFEKYMRPILDAHLPELEKNITCSNSVILNSWKLTEVPNAYDYNLDGILVEFSSKRSV